MKINFERIIPDVWWDFFGRLVPGLVVMSGLRYFACLPSTVYFPTTGVGSLVTAYVLGHLLQPFGSRLEGIVTETTHNLIAFFDKPICLERNRRWSNRRLDKIRLIIKSEAQDVGGKLFSIKRILMKDIRSKRWFSRWRVKKIAKILNQKTSTFNCQLIQISNILGSANENDKELKIKAKLKLENDKKVSFSTVINLPILISGNIMAAKKKHCEAVSFFSIFVGGLFLIAILPSRHSYSYAIFKDKLYYLILVSLIIFIAGTE